MVGVVALSFANTDVALACHVEMLASIFRDHSCWVLERIRQRRLTRLKEEGKVRYIGVSNFSVQQMQRALAIAPITSLQPHSIATREIKKENLPCGQANHTGVIVYPPCRRGC
jgi:aryl-alcohol dehydrogenase-like predicted oxidoreductase